MIVIPPSTFQEEYFRGMAENSWNISTEKHNDSCQALKSENKTMVITCKVAVSDNMESIFHLHYRYFRSTLYCFVEEKEPSAI